MALLILQYIKRDASHIYKADIKNIKDSLNSALKTWPG